MINVNSDGQALSSRYGSTVRSPDRKFLVRLRDEDGTEIQCSIKRLEITRGSCASETFSVGNIAAASVTAELLSLEQEIKGHRIAVEIGLLTDAANDTWEYVTQGKYLITDVQRTIYSTKITGHGRLVADSTGEFTPPSVKTLARLRTELAAELGCTVGTEAGFDGSLVIDIPAGVTTYQAMQIIASVTGGFLCDVPNGDVRICRYKTGVNATIDTSIMRKLPEVEEQDFAITGVRCIVSEASRGDEGEDIPAVGYESGGPINLELKDPYMTQQTFDYAIQRLIGYQYRPGFIDMALGDPRIESTDVINVKDVDGTIYRMPCHQIRHIYDGGFRTEFSAVRGTNEANSIGTKTPFQKAISSISSRVIAVKETAGEAKRVASDTAQYFWFTGTGTDTGAHITEIPQEQFLQDPANGGGNLLARSNGIAIRDGLDELATFTQDAVEIGPSGSGAKMTADSFAITKNQWTFFEVKDLAGEEYIETQFKGDGNRVGYSVGAQIKDIISVTVDGTAVTARAESSTIMLPSAPAAGANIVARWTADAAVPALSFGKPLQTGEAGTRSAAFGQSVASGDNAFAEGRITFARGIDSHAEGRYSIASGGISHAEGEQTEAAGEDSHAEGYNTFASGAVAHAEGESTEASGAASHAGGAGAIAAGHRSFAHGLMIKSDGEDMVTLGRCNDVGNTTPSSNGYALVVGNGVFDARTQTASSNSDALTLDWQGNLHIAGTLSQASDRRLKEHIDYLGDDAVEFVRALKPAHYRKDGQDHVGLYAQDVADADKWDCMTDDLNGYMTLSYTELIAPLVAYCQHLESRIKALEDDK